MAVYHDFNNFEYGVIVGARGMGHSISEVMMQFGFTQSFHECTVNIRYPIKHQMSDSDATRKDLERTRASTTVGNP